MKRQRIEEEASDWQMKEEEDEEERLAGERLKYLQEFAKKSLTEESSSNQPSSSSKPSLKSSWQQFGSLMVYTAAGVKGSDKVGSDSFRWSADMESLSTAGSVLYNIQMSERPENSGAYHVQLFSKKLISNSFCYCVNWDPKGQKMHPSK